MEYEDDKFTSSVPKFILDSINRDVFKQELASRKNDYLSDLMSEFSLNDTDEIIVRGDWHPSGATVQLKDKNIFVKPKPSSIEIYLSNAIGRINKIVDTRIRTPEITVKGRFQVQKEVDIEKGGDSEVFGYLLSLTFWFGLFDLHFENVIFGNSKAYLVDFDCAFWTNKSGFNETDRLQNSGLFYTSKKQLTNSLFWSLSSPSLDIILHSFQKLNSVISLYYDDIFADIDTLNKLAIRRVFLDTHLYSDFLKNRFLFGWDKQKTSDKWTKFRLKNNDLRDEIVNYEISCLQKWCIPHFVIQYGSVYGVEKDLLKICDYDHDVVVSVKNMHGKMLKCSGDIYRGVRNFVREYSIDQHD